MCFSPFHLLLILCCCFLCAVFTYNCSFQQICYTTFLNIVNQMTEWFSFATSWNSSMLSLAIVHHRLKNILNEKWIPFMNIHCMMGCQHNKSSLFICLTYLSKITFFFVLIFQLSVDLWDVLLRIFWIFSNDLGSLRVSGTDWFIIINTMQFMPLNSSCCSNVLAPAND